MISLSTKNVNDPMLEVFIFETSQQLEQLEQSVIDAEESKKYSDSAINEIFRIMHTIKSSAAMMLFNNISKVAHSTEDLFYFIRESKTTNIDISSLSDIVFEGIDFMKLELEKIKNGEIPDGLEDSLIVRVNNHLEILKKNNNQVNVINKDRESSKQQYYITSNKQPNQNKSNTFKTKVFFQNECGMENIRAFTIIHNLRDITEEFYYIPEDIIENNESSEVIIKEGFQIYLKTELTYKDMESFFEQVAFLDRIELIQLENDEEYINNAKINNLSNDIIIQPKDVVAEKEVQTISNKQNQSMISVNVQKLDKLMDLVGELVIVEAMVTQNPDFKGMTLDSFDKSARQLRKISSELQDTVMSIRMVPLGPTFFKMNRIVRDMSKKLNKEIHLDIIGEETEVDKNIIEHIGDPLMHLVRNSIDHGIETAQERISFGKPSSGTVTLEAKNAGGEVFIIIKDDGKGLNKQKILKKAIDNELLIKSPDEMTDKEIFNLILLPGFSTKEAVTEFSGRGVGMDVVVKNIESVGGTIQVESAEGEGTTITLKIPLTLAIIDGMNIRVGKSRYTIPTISIRESFRPKENEIFNDPDGNEMIMIRGCCYHILRIHRQFKVATNVTNIHEGIILMVENESKTICIFADELIGEQQVVVKSLPNYIKSIKKINGLAGCTLLGDGSVSLILDVNGLLD